MKKLACTILALVFSCMLAIPAASADQGAALQAASAGSALKATDLEPCSTGQDVGDAVPASMSEQVLIDLNNAGKLGFTGSLGSASIAESNAGNGLMFTAKTSKLNDGRIVVASDYDFGSRTVGRICVDGLCDRGYIANVLVFLDDSETPVTTVRLGSQQGKVGWGFQDPRAQDVLALGISGSHTVSIALDVSRANDPSADKKTSVLLRSFEFAASSLPVVYFDLDETLGSIDSMNGSYDHSRECYGTMCLQIPAGYTSEYTGETTTELIETTYDLEYIRGRGNSTWDADKKPYKVKLDKKADLFGMGANKHWVLLANRYDNSLMRNKLTYWLGQELGMEFTPQCVFVEVMMNGRYLGSYYLCEQVRVGSSRVDIDDLDDEPEAVTEPGVTGGYLLSMAADDPDSFHSFTTRKGHTFTLESPAFEEAVVEEQYNYIEDFVQKTEDSIYANGFALDGKTYDQYLDVPSAVDYYWVQMLSMNGDAYLSGSTYLYKKRDAFGVAGKLYWGPLWDFDFVAWGDLEYDYHSVEGFATDSAPWLDRLLLDENFSTQFGNRWDTLKALMGEATRAGGKLDQWHDELAVSRFYDTERWGVYGENVWQWDQDAIALGAGEAVGAPAADGEGSSPSDTEELIDPADRSYQDEVNQLRSWIDERVAWVDQNISQVKAEPCEITFMVDDQVHATMTVAQDHPIGTLPSTPAKKGYLFAGWTTVIDGEEWFLDKMTIATGPTMTATAQWIEESQAVPARKLYLTADVAYAFVNDEFAMDYEVYPENTTNIDVVWSSSDPDIAEVDPGGWVSTHKVGTVTITGTCDNGVAASYILNVISYWENPEEQIGYPYTVSFAEPEIELPQGEAVQIKTAFEPDPSVYCSVSWVSLDPSIADVGPAGVVIGYEPGTTYILASLGMSFDFTACKVTVTESKLSIDTVNPQTYTGKQIKPNPTVKYDGKKLKMGRDYTIEYYDNINVGTAALNVTLKGDYNGEKIAPFTIVPKAPAVKQAQTNKAGKLTVSWSKPNKTQTKQITGYELRWAKAKSMKKAKTKRIKGAKKVKATIGKKQASKARYVQVRAYKIVDGVKYCSAWSKRTMVK